METKPLPPAVFLMGPTASGKTALAELLAQQWPFEVISVDSALVYRGMDIGTAKPDANLLARLPHRLVDIREPSQPYSVAEFRDDALAEMADITAAGRVPLLVGGTMLYFKVLLEGIADLPPTDPELRARVAEEARREGWQAMHAKLAEVDPQAAAGLHPNHSQRIQRALEVYYLTGRSMTELQGEQDAEPIPYNVAQFALWPEDRAVLHQRIEQRFHAMLEQGFVEEVRQLRMLPGVNADLPALRSVGYRQAWDYLDGSINYDQFIQQGIAATRQLAKRQLTWLRKWQNLNKLVIEQSDQASNSPITAGALDKFALVMQELGL